MNKQLTEQLNKLIVQKGAQIQSVLPPHRAHPQGRIATAHIYSVIKSVMGVPMKDCRDCRYDDIVQVIQYVVDNADKHSIMDGLRHFKKEPVYEPVSLENFF